MNVPRIVFAGTPEFAAVTLRALLAAGMKPVAVLTQPDRPAGRGKKLTASPVKKFAKAEGIEVLQPPTLRDDGVLAELTALAPETMIVAAYGLLLPQSVLDIPAAGCLNVHASLLPRWRGAAPVQAAILAGDQETGVCLMRMTAGLDSGPVYACDSLSIRDAETAGELGERLAIAGGRLLTAQLPAILGGRLAAIPQDDGAASYAHKIRTADAELDWQQAATGLARAVRAYNPVPGAYFMLGDQRIKCWRADAIEDEDSAPGRVLRAGPEGIVVGCGAGALRMHTLQRPGKRPVPAGEFATQVKIAGQVL